MFHSGIHPVSYHHYRLFILNLNSSTTCNPYRSPKASPVCCVVGVWLEPVAVDGRGGGGVGGGGGHLRDDGQRILRGVVHAQDLLPTLGLLHRLFHQGRLREREMFYLTTHSTHFIYGYMASDIWLRTILIVRKETHCRHIGYSYRLTARVLLYAPSHRQDNTYHGLCYTSRGALAGTRNSSMGPSQEGSI